MVFSSRVVGNALFYNENFKLSSDYQFICEVVSMCIKQEAEILKIDDLIASFSLGGAHQVSRKIGMKEDFYIRRNVLGMSFFLASCFYVAHYIHMVIKNNAGFIYEWYRYKKSC